MIGKRWVEAERTVNATEAAKLLDVTPHTIWRWIDKGILNADKNRREFVILTEDVYKFSKEFRIENCKPEKKPHKKRDFPQEAPSTKALQLS